MSRLRHAQPDFRYFERGASTCEQNVDKMRGPGPRSSLPNEFRRDVRRLDLLGDSWMSVIFYGPVRCGTRRTEATLSLR